MKTIAFGGIEVPHLGQGTYHMGEQSSTRAAEVTALQLGLDLGMTLIDTAEMYADGDAERVVAEAIHGRRDEVFLVSKVLPYNASRSGTIRAAEQSLRRLKVDAIDLYLLHWEGSHPLEGTLEAFAELQADGKIRRFGVSNFDLAAMQNCWASRHGAGVCANQILYNLTRRGIEWDLMEECQRRQVTIMAYSPLEQGRLRETSTLTRVAQRHAATPAQIALAFTLNRDDVMAIPKATSQEHVHENAAAASIQLTAQDLADLDSAYPPPTRKSPLETL